MAKKVREIHPVTRKDRAEDSWVVARHQIGQLSSVRLRTFCQQSAPFLLSLQKLDRPTTFSLSIVSTRNAGPADPDHWQTKPRQHDRFRYVIYYWS